MIGIGLYVKNSLEAAELYKSAFGLELGYHVLNEDGSYFHSELMKNGKEFISVVEAKREMLQGKNPVQLGVTFESKAELEKAFELLRDGGKTELELCELPWSPCAAEVTDRFGVNWYLTLAQHRPDDGWQP